MSKSAKRIPSLRAGAKRVFRRRQRATTARRATRTAAPLGTPSLTQPAAAVPQTIYLQMVTFAMVIMCVVAIALSRRPVPLAAADAEHVDLDRLHQSDLTPLPTTVVPAAAPTASAGAVAVGSPAAPTAKAAVLKSEKTRIAEAPSPTAAVAAIDEALAREDASTKFAPSESISADPAPVSVDPVAPGSVRVTGCLESSGNNRFQLTDTEGTDAPRSRSWRSGFLRKRSSSVALVTPPDPETLRTQVGQRIAATGQLTSRELRVTSVEVLGARCD